MEKEGKIFLEISGAEKDRVAEDYRQKYQNYIKQVSNHIIGYSNIIKMVLLCLFTAGQSPPSESSEDPNILENPVFPVEPGGPYDKKRFAKRPDEMKYQGPFSPQPIFLTRPHIMLVSIPGLSKTTLAKIIAILIKGIHFNRLQATPDLLPMEIFRIGVLTGMGTESKFRYEFCKAFTNFFLIDEFNRAPSKLQAAFLELMQEGQVSLGDDTYFLLEPYFVIATMNPGDQEGTFPISETQWDRFACVLRMDYLSKDEEVRILSLREGSKFYESNKSVITHKDILDITRFIHWYVEVPEKVKEYAVELARATRPFEKNFGARIRNEIFFQSLSDMVGKAAGDIVECGCSPRAAIDLISVCKTKALLEAGRYNVTVDDVRELAPYFLQHRIKLNEECVVNLVRQSSMKIRKVKANGEISGSPEQIWSEDELKEQIVNRILAHKQTY